MMSKRTLLFAPARYNLAETSRMVEIAKGIERHPQASQVFRVHFISDSSDSEGLIEKHGFALTRIELRLTKEKIQHIARVDAAKSFRLLLPIPK
jgi:predicted xylose isomerase-like sugar epimerase